MAAKGTRHGFDRHARLTQPGEISFYGAQAHSEPTCEHGTRHWLSHCTEELHEPLLPLHPPQREVAVTSFGS
jgi:hypothetical protein